MGELTVKLIFAIIAAAVGSGFQHGYHTGVINVPGDLIKLWIELNTPEEKIGHIANPVYVDWLWTLVASLMPLGGVIGGFLVTPLSAKLSARLALICNNILVVIASILMGVTDVTKLNIFLMIGRFIIGINCGLNAGLCQLFLSEILPVSLQGASGSVYQLVVSISILLSQLLGHEAVLGSSNLWAMLFVMGLPFALLQVITLFFCPASPKSEGGSKKLTLSDILRTRHYRKPFCVVAVLMIAQQFSGISAVIFYSSFTFLMIGTKESVALYATILIGIINVVMTIVSFILMKIFGRRILLLIGFAGMTFVTLLLSIAMHFARAHALFRWVSIILVFVYIILFTASAGSVPWVLILEMFVPEARPPVFAVAVAANFFGSFVVTFSFFLIQEHVMGPLVFLFFVGFDCMCLLYIANSVPETKNKAIEEIQKEWN